MTTASTQNKIMFLIAPPRSLSTAFLRMMGERNDVTVMNEPNCCVYNRNHYPHSRHMYSEDALTTYQEAKNKIFALAHDKHVFVKEMSFSFEEFITAKPDLMTNPNVYFTFLLRDPHPCIISYYKKIPGHTIDFIIPNFKQLTGFPSLYNSFRLIQDGAVNKPFIINAEDLYTHTKETVQAFCQYVQLPYHDKHLGWSNLGETFTGFETWQENKQQELTHHWHHEAISSKGFHQPTRYDLDEGHKPTFIEITNNAHRNKCIDVYHASKKMYDWIKEVECHLED